MSVNRMPSAQPLVLGKEVERARREHKLSTSILAMLSGLTDAQVQAIEEGGLSAFVNHEHRAECARRIALAMGLPPEHFLQADPSAASPAIAAMPVPRRIVQQNSGTRLAREAWEHLPVAGLDVLAKLRATEMPAAAAVQRRHGSPLILAMLLALALAGLLVALAMLH